MHQRVRERKIHGTGHKGKTIVMGMLERDGDIKVQVIANTEKTTLHSLVTANVLKGCNVYTDAWRGYNGLDAWYAHQIIDHSAAYVQDQIHTNGLENFWSLLKRTLKGTYVSVEPFHLFRYLDEQSFRFNERHGKDSDRFFTVASQTEGKRLTYKKLTGKESAAAQV